MKFLAIVGATVIAIPIIIIIGVLGIIWRAWWLYPAWGWFLVPLGVHQISLWHFTALMFLLATLTHQSNTKKDERKEDWSSMLGVVVLYPIVAWLILWFIHGRIG